MKHSKLLLPILVVLALLTAGVTHPVNAATGLLYINPPQQGAFPVGTMFTAQVKVANMAPFNNWDIHVSVDPTVISPTGFTIMPNVLTANFSITELELSHCVNGVGSGCDINDGPGVIHSATFPLGAPPAVASISGLILTITYSVVSTKPFSTIHIFNDVLGNGTPVPTPHTTQDGAYGVFIAAPVACFTVTGNNTVVGSTVTFNASCTTGTSPTFTWMFGDGTTGSGSIVSHVYATAGTFMVTLTASNSAGTSSASTHVVVLPPEPSFARGKLHWTHHLSLSKSVNTQTWTAIVSNPRPTAIFVQIHIVGMSIFTTTRFDITCGMNCVNTPGTPTPVTIAATTLSIFSFTQAIPAGFANDKLCFTGSLQWGDTATTITHTSATTKSGCFAVVP